MAVVVTRLNKLQRGSRLGKYRLHSRIADGGFSEVWKARDTVEGTSVALKIPTHSPPGSDEEEDLLKEIQLCARFDHPHILRLRNADRIGRYYVLASDLATESLEQRMQRRLSTQKALDYIRQILLGLGHAHERRVIHRDLKPSNILLFPNEHVRIADFGLARIARHDMISATGSGTLQYLAPEQAHGYPCFASDVFSVGLLCHEMLTGHLPRWPFEWPFPGAEILDKRVPESLRRWIRRAVRRNHNQRFRNAVEMRAGFERLELTLRRFFAPTTRRKRQPRLGVWKDLRFREFQRAFGRSLFLRFQCPDCSGPVSEHMFHCPWCGTGRLAFGEESDFPHFCSRCERGLRDEWRYCPWCWGPGFENADGKPRPDSRYHGQCRSCRAPLIEGMRYCPWCHVKCTRPIRIEELRDRCPKCRGAVSRDYWDSCPWCGAASHRRSCKT